MTLRRRVTLDSFFILANKHIHYDSCLDHLQDAKGLGLESVFVVALRKSAFDVLPLNGVSTRPKSLYELFISYGMTGMNRRCLNELLQNLSILT